MAEVLSTLQSEPARFTTSGDADYGSQSSLVLPGYTWEHYLSLDELFQDSGVRVRFLNHHIEIMPPISGGHESRKGTVGFLVEGWCFENKIDIWTQGSTTLKREGEAGGEPDESYCFHERKDRPDLAIEIALTSGGLSKQAFYQVFKVPEVWIWRNEKLEVFVLDNESGEYKPSAESLQLPGFNFKAAEQCATITPLNRARKEFLRLISEG